MESMEKVSEQMIDKVNTLIDEIIELTKNTIEPVNRHIPIHLIHDILEMMHDVN